MYTCGALCTTSSDECTAQVKDIVSNVMGIAVDIAFDVITGSFLNIPDIIAKAGKVAQDLANAICDPPKIENLFLTSLVQ